MISPAGIIIQNARGASSCVFSSSSDAAVRDSTRRVVRLHVVAVLAQALGHPVAHAAEADHSELHCRPPRVDSRDAAAALLQRLIVSGGLGADQAAKPNARAGNRQLVAGVVDDLQEEAGVRAALVELPGGVEVARAEAVRDDVARSRARARRAAASVVLARRVDERLDADVVAVARLREQLVERALRLELDVAAARAPRSSCPSPPARRAGRTG